MKNINKIFFLLAIIFNMIYCDSKNDLSDKDCYSCPNEDTSEIFTNIQAKIFVNNKYATNKDSVIVYAISISKIDFNNDTWTISKDSILVPCNLSEDFKKSNQKILLSGVKKNCCDILTTPDLRSTYGCKFEITNIQKF